VASCCLGVAGGGGCRSFNVSLCSTLAVARSVTGTSRVLAMCWLYCRAQPSVNPFSGRQNSRIDSAVNRSHRPSSFCTYKHANIHTDTCNCLTGLMSCHSHCNIYVQCESEKNPPPPEALWQFFQNGWEFFNQILHDYYASLSTLYYEFVLNYLQLWRIYAILSAITQYTSCAQNVHHRPKRTLAFSDIFWVFPQTVKNF